MRSGSHSPDTAAVANRPDEAGDHPYRPAAEKAANANLDSCVVMLDRSETVIAGDADGRKCERRVYRGIEHEPVSQTDTHGSVRHNYHSMACRPHNILTVFRPCRT
jgi:hypothetical protein